MLVLQNNKLYICSKRDYFYRFRKNIKKIEEIKDIRSRQICFQHSHSQFTDFIFGFSLLFNLIQAALIILFQKHPIKKKSSDICIRFNLLFIYFDKDSGFNVDGCRMVSCYRRMQAVCGGLKQRRQVRLDWPTAPVIKDLLSFRVFLKSIWRQQEVYVCFYSSWITPQSNASMIQNWQGERVHLPSRLSSNSLVRGLWHGCTIGSPKRGSNKIVGTRDS